MVLDLRFGKTIEFRSESSAFSLDVEIHDLEGAIALC